MFSSSVLGNPGQAQQVHELIVWFLFCYNIMFCCMLFFCRHGITQLPPEMTNNFKRMWCTHGASRESRGEGRRDYDSQFTGCEAGFLVRSERAVVDGQAKWQVSVAPGSEISLHNHKTNKLIYDSYHGAKSMLLTPQARQELGLLTEMKASTADITRYLSDKLDMVITPQVTRNIVRQVLGKSSTERSKVILDSFADEDSGNEVLLVQDQLDITCIIAMQTSVQKTCFEHGGGGGSVVMDWTHGTNNLGYHLGMYKSTLALLKLTGY
ncbi:hypothetical protein GQ600_6759 [Phytophthora cactorum]|nr:hypothetical protein GQ600_6759 [Phytophthora cactorum]